ncbi:MAG: hypothetical protein KatS3mg020_0901 [Fimbriimonadales bacterium]|nr:MAG: hypothetical protein KatS3mg020_0901 [Fimbriimonadales bacterium]
MVHEMLVQVMQWEQQMEQQAREYLELLQPVLQTLGVQFQLEVSRSASDSLAHYRSTLDVRFVDEEGRVLWVDALILYLNSVRWSEVEDVRPFLQSALRETLRSWRLQYGK